MRGTAIHVAVLTLSSVIAASLFSPCLSPSMFFLPPSCRFLKLRYQLSDRANWSSLLAEHHHPLTLNKVNEQYLYVCGLVSCLLVVIHVGQLCPKGRDLQWLLHVTSSNHATRISATRIQDSKVSWPLADAGDVCVC